MKYQPIMTNYTVMSKINSSVVLIDTWDLLQAMSVYSNAVQNTKAGEIVTLFRTEPDALPVIMAKAYYCGKLTK